MANSFQVTIDAAGPRALGTFWCDVLGYVEQPPPPGFDTWEGALDAMGIDRSDPDRAFAIVDPEGVGPRVFFQKVPYNYNRKKLSDKARSHRLRGGCRRTRRERKEKKRKTTTKRKRKKEKKMKKKKRRKRKKGRERYEKTGQTEKSTTN